MMELRRAGTQIYCRIAREEGFRGVDSGASGGSFAVRSAPTAPRAGIKIRELAFIPTGDAEGAVAVKDGISVGARFVVSSRVRR